MCDKTTPRMIECPVCGHLFPHGIRVCPNCHAPVCINCD